MKKKTSLVIPLLVLMIVVAVIAIVGIFLTRNLGKSGKQVSAENALDKLAGYVKDIDPQYEDLKTGSIEFTGEDTTFQELPELTDDSIKVSPTTSEYAEIFASSEKTGSGYDGWLREMAEQFNKSNGTYSIMLREVSSGQQIDYVASGKYTPDAISPSSDLFIKMLEARGTKVKEVNDSLVSNYAGIVLSNEAYSTLTESYSGDTIENFAQATIDKKIIIGYTNPFTSATGMNFLVSLLYSYDKKNMLSNKAISGFQEFQKNIPFVAMTTGQLRQAAENGKFDAFISEYQSYVNDSALTGNYKFIPFGVEHNNPLVAIDSTQHMDILEQFSQFCKDNGADLAKKYGFNAELKDYVKMSYDLSGSDLIQAQSLYKENKDSEPVMCVFVADVSGSMAGARLNNLKKSLTNSMQYIKDTNYVGIVTYSTDVTIALPIEQFDLEQQSFFKGAVDAMSPSGNTATFDAVAVAMNMIMEKQKDLPDTKAMIFLLTDGETTSGLSFDKCAEIVKALNIPIYTIGYEATIENLEEISGINEAITIDADVDDVTYQLKQLFNANM